MLYVAVFQKEIAQGKLKEGLEDHPLDVRTLVIRGENIAQYFEAQAKAEQAQGGEGVIHGVEKRTPSPQKEGERNASGAAWSNK